MHEMTRVNQMMKFSDENCYMHPEHYFFFVPRITDMYRLYSKSTKTIPIYKPIRSTQKAVILFGYTTLTHSVDLLFNKHKILTKYKYYYI